MTTEKSSIIRSYDIGPNYRAVSVRTSVDRTVQFDPGQCAIVNGRWLAIATARSGEVEFIVKKDSFLFSEPVNTIQIPVGPGFLNLDEPDILCIAAGTGLGAFIELALSRKNIGLDTNIQLYARNIKSTDVTDIFPHLDVSDFGCWDTTQWGRPKLASEVFALTRGKKVFFAGPNDMLKEMRSIPGFPSVNLNF